MSEESTGIYDSGRTPRGRTAHNPGGQVNETETALAKAWDEYQSALDVDIEVAHIRRRDGSCVISVNGQGHLPCSEHEDPR